MRKSICILVSVLMLLCSSMVAQQYDDGLKRSTPEAQGVRSEAIAEAFQKLNDKD